MAKIGLRNFKYAILDTDTNTYDGAKSLGKAVDFKFSPDNNSAEFYADDGLAESDSSFKKGTVSMTIDDDDPTVFAKILGHNISEDGEMVRKDSDKAPYIGCGRIITKVISGVTKYTVEFLSKSKFKEPSPEEKTKGESIEFAGTSIEGTSYTLDNGEWSRTKTFTSRTEAETYLDSLMAVSS